MRRLGVLIALACGLGTAAADEREASPKGDKPWAAGVPAELQSKALLLYQQGNALFEQAKYLDALEAYQVALRSWDHPSIRYNAAVCLINLGRTVEAYDNLMAALRFGGEPLSSELQHQAQTYEAMLSAQLATLEVQCKEPAAKVSLDGSPLLECPGSKTRKVAPGHHELVAQKPGYETTSHAFDVGAGGEKFTELGLVPLDTKGTL